VSNRLNASRISSICSSDRPGFLAAQNRKERRGMQAVSQCSECAKSARVCIGTRARLSSGYLECACESAGGESHQCRWDRGRWAWERAMMFMPGVGIRLKMVQTEVVRALRPTSGRWARTLGRAATRATNGRHLVRKRQKRKALRGKKPVTTGSSSRRARCEQPRCFRRAASRTGTV